MFVTARKTDASSGGVLSVMLATARPLQHSIISAVKIKREMNRIVGWWLLGWLVSDVRWLA